MEMDWQKMNWEKRLDWFQNQEWGSVQELRDFAREKLVPHGFDMRQVDRSNTQVGKSRIIDFIWGRVAAEQRPWRRAVRGLLDLLDFTARVTTRAAVLAVAAFVIIALVTLAASYWPGRGQQQEASPLPEVQALGDRITRLETEPRVDVAKLAAKSDLDKAKADIKAMNDRVVNLESRPVADPAKVADASAVESLQSDMQALQNRIEELEAQPNGIVAVAATNTEEAVICRADKISTINELATGGPQRMEVSTGDKVHLDYYSKSGVPSVSVIVHKDEEAILKGYGSMWQFPLRDCGSYDFIKDATEYARGRKDWGHSGLVYASLEDFLKGKDPAVNLWNLKSKDWPRPVLWEEKEAPAPTATPAPAATPTPTAEACPEGKQEVHPPVVGQPWEVGGDDTVVIVNFWTNQPGKDQTERKLFLSPGEKVKLLGGGSAWSWPARCEKEARDNYEQNPLPAVTLEQLKQEGLVKS